MFIVIQGRYSDARTIAVYNDPSEIPKAILAQPQISVQELLPLPEIKLGEVPWEV